MFMHPRVGGHPFPDRLHGELVWRNGGDPLVHDCHPRRPDLALRVRSGDVQNLRLPALQHRIQAEVVSALGLRTHG